MKKIIIYDWLHCFVSLTVINHVICLIYSNLTLNWQIFFCFKTDIFCYSCVYSLLSIIHYNYFHCVKAGSDEKLKSHGVHWVSKWHQVRATVAARGNQLVFISCIVNGSISSSIVAIYYDAHSKAHTGNWSFSFCFCFSNVSWALNFFHNI